MRQQKSLYIDLRPEKPVVAIVTSLKAPFVIEELQTMENLAALRELCRTHNPKARYTRAIIGSYPESRFLRHAILENPSLTREENYFDNFFKTQYQLELSENAVTILNPSTGIPVDMEKVVPKEIIIAGALQKEFLQLQSEIVSETVYPERLELGTISTLGGVMNYLKLQQTGSSVAVLEWGRKQSLFTICSAKKVELSRVLSFGTEPLMQEIKTDLGLKDDVSAHKLLSTGNFDFTEMGPMFLKKFIKELQASAGFFEVQTGQALKYFIITLLPQQLGWVETVLAQYLGLDLLSLDYEGWANTLRIKSREGGIALSELKREHLPIFCLMVNMFLEHDGEKRSS